MKRFSTCALLLVVGLLFVCLSPGHAQSRRKGGIAWRSSFAAAMKEAKRTGKPVMVDFYATWCGPCHMLDQQTWPHASVIKAARPFVPVKVDADKAQALATKYKIIGLPTVMFLRADGSVAYSFTGFVPPREAAQIITRAYKQARQKPVKTKPRQGASIIARR